MNYEIVKEIIGINGRMISGSKSGYRAAYPENEVIFNANICTKDGKIWYGDLDLTFDSPKLQKIACTLEKDIYILREMDARFENEEKPLLDKAVKVFKPFEKKISISLYKVQTLNNAEYPQEEKYPSNTEIANGFISNATYPVLNEPFYVIDGNNVARFRTSPVQKIELSDESDNIIIKTINSEYIIRLSNHQV